MYADEPYFLLHNSRLYSYHNYQIITTPLYPIPPRTELK